MDDKNKTQQGTESMNSKKIEVIELDKGFEIKGIKPVAYEFIGLQSTELSNVTHLTRPEFNERVTELKEKLRTQSSKVKPEESILHPLDNFMYPSTHMMPPSSRDAHWGPPSSRDCTDLSSEFQDVTTNQPVDNHTLDSEPFSDAFPNKKAKMIPSSDFAAISSDQSIIDSGL